MEGKNVVIGAVLIAVIIVAAVLGVRRATSKPQAPQWLLDRQIEKIDIKSLDVVTEQLGDWNGKYAPDASGRFKNPKTGEYTMVEVMKCAACGQAIPVMQLPAELRAVMPDRATLEKLRSEYKCPKCGKSPFPDRVAPSQPG